ncbi:hypothetical protein [Pseudomonas sp. LP_7_YM]|uniref:hypothetical protein n=1 Tax=Pseudomonas sp. LP_7_YM TaxID=2485137 RepID=UPI0010612E89|nr:hypothetical protein [Pseudomonas sp. LP_7_YM]TDV58966.1 hypothetical protein EC915_12117 [Pseudomonas sp. LP_7_YM]
MNLIDLKKAAMNLEIQLNVHSKIDPEAVALYWDLKPLLDKAKAGSISEPIEVGAVPGRYRFTERNLQQYGDLEEAYAIFSIEITGGETPALKYVRELLRKQ